ncbi:MAG TPA: hypothetical protein VLI05_05300 [Candidatus Saccharimonadia bacterium]|nr:hypothetical protein [Candidatus Saccharimonadia bacterium]
MCSCYRTPAGVRIPCNQPGCDWDLPPDERDEVRQPAPTELATNTPRQ